MPPSLFFLHARARACLRACVCFRVVVHTPSCTLEFPNAQCAHMCVIRRRLALLIHPCAPASAPSLRRPSCWAASCSMPSYAVCSAQCCAIYARFHICVFRAVLLTGAGGGIGGVAMSQWRMSLNWAGAKLASCNGKCILIISSMGYGFLHIFYCYIQWSDKYNISNWIAKSEEMYP